MVSTGYNATCGGLWWKHDHLANNAIENSLFLLLAGCLANRSPQNAAYYRTWALKQWAWFEASGLINDASLVNDGLNLTTCRNNNGTTWSYNQGIVIRALVELNRAAPNPYYIRRAHSIARATIARLSDVNGILHDPTETTGSADVPTFKGVLMRSLLPLAQLSGDEGYKDFILRNSESIWLRNRDGTSNKLGPVWSGPYMGNATSAVTQGAALDAIGAAAAVQRGSGYG